MGARFTFLLSFLVLLTIYSLTSRGGYDGYELENYLTAENIFLHQKISLAFGYYNLPGIVNTNDGQDHYVRHGIIQPIFETPFYAVGYMVSQFVQLKPPVVETSTSKIGLIDPMRLFTVSLFNPLVTALTALVVGSVVLELLKGDTFARSHLTKVTPLRWGLVAILIYGLGTLAWPYVEIGMEPLMVLSLTASFFFWLRWKNGASPNDLIFLGISLFILINSKSYAWVFSLPFVISPFPALGLEKKSSLFQRRLLNQPLNKSLIVFLFLIIFGFLVFFLFNLLKSDRLFGQDQGSYLSSLSLGMVLVNLLTMTISFGKSIFIYSPILLLSLVGAKSFIRRFSAESKMILALFGLWFLIFLPLWYVSADEMWGPRYLLPLVPFLTIVGVNWLKEKFDGSNHRTGYLSGPGFFYFLILLFVLSVYIQLLGVLYWSTTPLKIASAAGAKNMEQINFDPRYSPIVVNAQLLRSTVSRLTSNCSLFYQAKETETWAGQGGVPKNGPAVDLSQFDNNLVIWPARFFRF